MYLFFGRHREVTPKYGPMYSLSGIGIGTVPWLPYSSLYFNLYSTLAIITQSLADKYTMAYLIVVVMVWNRKMIHTTKKIQTCTPSPTSPILHVSLSFILPSRNPHYPPQTSLLLQYYVSPTTSHFTSPNPILPQSWLKLLNAFSPSGSTTTTRFRINPWLFWSLH